MEYYPDKREIILDRELSNLDLFVNDFVKILKRHMDYVIVSGYVSILLGRTRATEDVDLLIPKMEFGKFNSLFEDLIKNGFECANTMIVNEAYGMLNSHAIRFFKKGSPIPNIEFKVIKNDIDKYSFDNQIKVKINNDLLIISSLEMQVAFKLFLAADGTDRELQSDKDIEDARHIYKLFEDKINKEELLSIIDKLNIQKRLKWLK